MVLPPASLVLAIASKALNSLKEYAWQPMARPLSKASAGMGVAVRFVASMRAVRRVVRMAGWDSRQFGDEWFRRKQRDGAEQGAWRSHGREPLVKASHAP